MQRIEHGRLGVRQKGHAEEQIGVPQRRLPGSQLSHAIGPVRCEVGERIHTRQHPIGEAQRPEDRQRRQRQGQPRQEVTPKMARRRGCLRLYPMTHLPVILSLSKGGWRLRKIAPFDELRVLSIILG